VRSFNLKGVINMMCYRDMTFCTYYKECKAGNTCDRALTYWVKAEARAWWGGVGVPIATYADKPECFQDKEEVSDND
jgi:murein endopeptidase